MRITMFGAMGIGVVFAALLLAWEEVSVTLHGYGTFAQTLPFTLFSLLAILLFGIFVLRAPDNDS